MTNTRQSQITEHMPEPWTYDHMATVRDARANIIADCAITPECGGFTPTQEQEVANARRLCAAVNACQGLSSDALQQGVVRELLEGLMDLLGDLPSVQECVCRHCGRDYDDIHSGDCPSDDCPSFKARAAIAKAGAGAPLPNQEAALANADDFLSHIAKKHLGIPTLKPRMSDALDFHDVAVWQVKNALKAAFQAGAKAACPCAESPGCIFEKTV